MFDIQNASNTGSGDSSANGIANILKHVRMNGPAVKITGSGASGLQSGAAAVPQVETYGATPIAFSPTAQSLGSLAAERAPVRSPITVLQEQQAQYGVPPDPHDPKYRMGMGQRILGTLANFANGFARSGASPVYVGPGALNNRYYQDEALREQNLDNINRQLTEQHSTKSEDSDKTGTTLQDEDGHGNVDFPPGHWQPYETSAVQKVFPPGRWQPLQTQAGAPPRTQARATFASLHNARTQPNYRYFGRHSQSNQLIGSHDGQNWKLIPDQAQTTSA